MNDEKLKLQLGANIVAYRKQYRLTQAALAEKLNYSDKAVSKCERGESMPDVMTLVQLAEIFEVTVDDLLKDPNALPESSSAVEKAVERTLKRKADKGVICKLVSILVWFVSLLSFVVTFALGLYRGWVAFFYAIPVDAIALLSLRSAWRDYRWNELLISAIAWGTLLSVYISLLVFCGFNYPLLFVLGIPGQAAIFFWFRMFRTVSKEENNG